MPRFSDCSCGENPGLPTVEFSERGGGSCRNVIARNPLRAYFAIAFGVTWVTQIPALIIAWANNQVIGIEHNLQHLIDLVRRRLTADELTAYLLFSSAQVPSSPLGRLERDSSGREAALGRRSRRVCRGRAPT